ncbi:MAG: methyltransferase domain-containing protein [Pedobacter sp.]|nr:MAG: methyltransferase domain-containing protein [Pedobacter sp.]
MDDFSMEGDILKDALDKIADINRLLGGNKVTLEGVKKLLEGGKIQKDQEISILDVGCGNGDMLRALADYASENGLKFKLTGMDANAFTVHHAQSLSVSYPNISYLCADIFEEIKQAQVYDVILCTLTLHHFTDGEIVSLTESFASRAKMGIVVNDLHRTSIAYYLFTTICFIFRLNKMSREDGLVSILRGFKRADLIRYSEQLKFTKYSIRWKWAFRYQWIIYTN